MTSDLEKLNWWAIHTPLNGKEHNRPYNREWKAEHPPAMVLLTEQRRLGPSRATNHTVGILLPPILKVFFETWWQCSQSVAVIFLHTWRLELLNLSGEGWDRWRQYLLFVLAKLVLWLSTGRVLIICLQRWHQLLDFTGFVVWEPVSSHSSGSDITTVVSKYSVPIWARKQKTLKVF